MMKKENQIKKAKPFVVTRAQHLQETAEDYTELIADLVEHRGEARTCEIARRMSISHVTALKTIRRLQKEGYLETAPHQPIMLTQKGKSMAALAKKRHSLLIEFLKKIGVPDEIAAVDAEGMEHHVSPQTLEAMKRYLE
jgi:DtxR family transcriptional regulator, manganese transport regulator